MSLTLAPAAITRRLRAAGVPVSSTTRLGANAARVYLNAPLRDGHGPEEAAAARLAVAVLIQAGYDAARNGWGEVTVTTPEAAAAEAEVLAEWAAKDLEVAEAFTARRAAEAPAAPTLPGIDAAVVEAELTGPVAIDPVTGATSALVLIDPRTPLAPEHLAAAVAEAAVIAAETDADVAADAEVAKRVVEHYVRIAVDNRADDVEEYLADVRTYPEEIVDEVVATAVDLGLGGDTARLVVLVKAAEAFIADARHIVATEVARREADPVAAACEARTCHVDDEHIAGCLTFGEAAKRARRQRVYGLITR